MAPGRRFRTASSLGLMDDLDEVDGMDFVKIPANYCTAYREHLPSPCRLRRP